MRASGTETIAVRRAAMMPATSVAETPTLTTRWRICSRNTSKSRNAAVNATPRNEAVVAGDRIPQQDRVEQQPQHLEHVRSPAGRGRDREGGEDQHAGETRKRDVPLHAAIGARFEEDESDRGDHADQREQRRPERERDL